MSKMDNLRAMREARYEAAQARAKGAGGAAKPPPKAASKAKPAVKKAAASEGTGDALCGHRNMGGRTCTREQGHSEKSHRYS